MSTASRDLILAEMVQGKTCRAWQGVEYGGVVATCSGEGDLVTLVCEHEHFYEVVICSMHAAEVPDSPLACPLCFFSLDDWHRCRHLVHGGAA